MTSKKITDENIISFLNDELDNEKSNFISHAMKTDKKLKLKIKSIQDLDKKMNLAADNAYQIPVDFLNTIDEIVSKKTKKSQISLKKKITDWLAKLTLISLMSGSAISGGAFASICLLAFVSIKNPILEQELLQTADNMSENPVYRGNLQLSTQNFPNTWLIQNEVAFALSYKITKNTKRSLIKNDKIIDARKKVEVNLQDVIVFSILPIKSKKVDVIYHSNDGNEIKIYSDLMLNKGEIFVSKKLTMSEPIGKDRITIVENKKVILEKIIKIIK